MPVHRISSKIKILLFCLLTPSLPAGVAAQTSGAQVNSTLGGFNKPNQSRVFKHDGTWFLTARAADKDWYIWKYNGSGWERGIRIDIDSKSRPDCIVDSPNNKLYIAISNTSNTRFLRASYSSDAWTIDSGYPVVIPGFSYAGEDVASFVRDQAGGLWIFRIETFALEAIYSGNDGQTWSQVIQVKSPLKNESGLTDAVAFALGNENYVGVAYGENTTATSEFGFVQHRLGDPLTSWTDETAAMGQFQGTEADNHVAAVADANGTVYIVTKTDGGGPTVAANGLYKRDASGWHRYPVRLSSGWTRPALVIDNVNRDLYVFGSYERDPRIAVFKKIAIGDEENLPAASETTIFENGLDVFKNISVPAQPINPEIDLMLAVENTTQNTVWFNLLDIIRFNKQPVAVASAAPVGGKVPLTVNFKGSDSHDPDGTVVSHAWDFGDQKGFSTTADPQYTYPAAGHYQARLIITDNEGKQDTAFVAIVVNPLQRPQAIAAATPTTGKPPLRVQFTGSPSTDADGNIVAYRWDFGDQSPISIEADPAHTYAVIGQYVATLIVTDDDGLKDTTAVNIAVNPPQPPTAVASANFDSASTITAVQFTGSNSADSDGQIVGYNWDFGDGIGSSTQADPQYTYSQIGQYRARLIVTDDDAMTDTAYVDITVIAANPPVAAIAATPTSGFAPLTVQFNSSASTSGTGTLVGIAWDFADGGATSTDVVAVHQFTTGGAYAVSLVVTNSIGLSDTAHIVINVQENHAPAVTIISPAADTMITVGEWFTYAGRADDQEDGQLPPSHFIWSMLNQESIENVIATNVRTATTRINQTGFYTLILKVKDSQGVASADSVRLNVVKATAVADGEAEAGSAPDRFKLAGIYPNPLPQAAVAQGDGFQIRFGVPRNAKTTIRVYNVLGQVMATLVENQNFIAGYHTLRWNGQTTAGRKVPVGVYFVRMTAGTFRTTQKLMIIR